ncbi:MAG: ankyrin repeat domain-containing protein [Steroidobacteraceae bacterium]
MPSRGPGAARLLVAALVAVNLAVAGCASIGHGTQVAASRPAAQPVVRTGTGDPSLPGAAPSVRGPDGSTPLMWAVYRQDVAAVKRLLRAGAEVDAANMYGATAMQMAATTGNAAILKQLLRAGANADSANAEGQTALMAVARTGNVRAAKLLIEHGANVNARERWGGQTALMWASARRHPQVMELLIRHGADVNARSVWRDWERHVTAESRAKRTNTGGLTPLMYAAREDCLQCVNVLIKHHVDVDQPDPDGVAPVTVAIMNDNWDIAARHIQAGCDANQWDIYGQGPLFAAIAANVHSPGSATAGPLDPSNRTTGMEVVRMLLDRGANPNMQLFYRPKRNGDFFTRTIGIGGVARGATPLFAAAATDDVQLVKLLLAHGADPRLYQADDQTPMMAALSGRGAFGGGGADNPRGAIAVLRVLHAAGTDVNVMSIQHHLLRTRGGTALHYAVRAGSAEAIKLLISWGVDVNAKDPDGLTALDYAMGRGYVPFLQQRKPPRLDLAKLLRGDGASVQLAQIPNWPPVGPPIGYEATIWPLQPSDGYAAASTQYPPMYPPGTTPPGAPAVAKTQAAHAQAAHGVRRAHAVSRAHAIAAIADAR